MRNVYLFVLFTLLLAANKVMSQNETLYIWENGVIINQQSIRTTDLDSITFKTPEVLICNQVWATRNLDVSTYRNGDPIPQVTDPTQWESLTTGAWCYNFNDPANGNIYGKLYNWYALNDPRGLAPIGWHVPSDLEWTTLTNCLGGEAVAGGAMKATGTQEAGTGLWHAPNEAATNNSGFTALPGSLRGNGGIFYPSGYECYFWSSTDAMDPTTPRAWNRTINYSLGGIFRYDTNKEIGSSIRCIRD